MAASQENYDIGSMQGEINTLNELRIMPTDSVFEKLTTLQVKRSQTAGSGGFRGVRTIGEGEWGSNVKTHVQIRLVFTIYLIISVYLSSLPVAHLSDASRRRLVVTGDSARIQDETTENSAWFFNVLGV